MGYLARINDNGVVEQVIVCDDPTWATDRLGGTWVETADPYSAEPQEVAYCGPGHGYDPAWPERFAPQWVQPAGADVEGAEPYPEGARVWHNGRMWRSTTADNVWEPGVSGWHDSPEDPDEVPQWVQPTGAHDAYAKGARVAHKGQVWESTVDANVWEPGVYGWVTV